MAGCIVASTLQETLLVRERQRWAVGRPKAVSAQGRCFQNGCVSGCLVVTQGHPSPQVLGVKYQGRSGGPWQTASRGGCICPVKQALPKAALILACSPRMCASQAGRARCRAGRGRTGTGHGGHGAGQARRAGEGRAGAAGNRRGVASFFPPFPVPSPLCLKWRPGAQRVELPTPWVPGSPLLSVKTRARGPGLPACFSAPAS